MPIDEFKSATNFFTCLSCLKKLHVSKMANMNDSIAALKTEVVELRAALKEVLRVATSESKQAHAR